MKEYRRSPATAPVTGTGIVTGLVMAALLLGGCSASNSSGSPGSPSSPTTGSATTTVISSAGKTTSVAVDESATTLPTSFPAEVPIPDLPLQGVASANSAEGSGWTLRYKVTGDPGQAVQAEAKTLTEAGFTPLSQEPEAAGTYVKQPYTVVLATEDNEMMVVVTRTP